MYLQCQGRPCPYLLGCIVVMVRLGRQRRKVRLRRITAARSNSKLAARPTPGEAACHQGFCQGEEEEVEGEEEEEDKEEEG